MVNNEVIGATITVNQGTSVNNDASFGDIKGSNEEQTLILKQILDKMSKGNDESSKTNKLMLAGILSLPGVLGGITDTTAIIAANLGQSAKDLIGGVEAIGNASLDSYWQKAMDDRGNTTYQQIDRKTGNILQTLTEEEAYREKITNISGEIYSILTKNPPQLTGMSDEITGSYEKVKLWAEAIGLAKDKTNDYNNGMDKLNSSMNFTPAPGGNSGQGSPITNDKTKQSYAAGSSADTWQNSPEYDNTFGKSLMMGNSQTSQATQDILTSAKLAAIIKGPESKSGDIQLILKTPR